MNAILICCLSHSRSQHQCSPNTWRGRTLQPCCRPVRLRHPRPIRSPCLNSAASFRRAITTWVYLAIAS